MNKRWNVFISSILGSFWEKIFKATPIIEWIKRVHYILYDTLAGLLNTAESRLSVNTPDNIILGMSIIDVPVSECAINVGTISNFSMSGNVLQSSPIPSISIPKEYCTGVCVLQNKVYKPSLVWIRGTNTVYSDKYMTLFTEHGYTPDTVTGYVNNKVVPMYRFYALHITSDKLWSENEGVLCGFDLNKYDKPVREALWEAYTRGVSDKVINTILSHSVKNDVCTADSTVVDMWKEGCVYNVYMRDGVVYSGAGEPIVRRGASVKAGDIIFSGVNVYNKTNVPESSEIPYLLIKHNGMTIKAVNTDIPALRGVIGTIPDMGNYEWYSLIIDGQNNGSIGALSYDHTINPLKYAIKYLAPGATTYFSITGNITEEFMEMDIDRLLSCSYPTAITSVYRCIKSEDIPVTVSGNPGSVSCVLESPEISVPVNISDVKYRYI